ncbi:protein PLASTID MOVEMENT IMPAIRED 2 isoform X1 [Neltuma alba]|uniref:protein PLASTID MOVEMENT IMPAIRED 2 isoform X1 n=1 Tax=Neltuma alba TaxID=207710 RepID=UPI0010A3B878|nr:protein PLASTID MOVEMENT IMPAIRED 2-like isoform X1 [Prosopis alba]
MEMNGSQIDRTRVGSVKTAISFYGDKIADSNTSSVKKTYPDFSAKPSPKGRETQRVRRDVNQNKESRWAAESEPANPKNTVKGISSKIEESSSKAKALVVRKNESYDYKHVMRELELIKQELQKLKFDVASVMEEKLRAEEEIKASRSKILSGSRAADELRKEIEDANEDHVLAELARIEALKELREIEAQREEEEAQFLSKMETTKKKMKEATDEIEKSKELEMKLAVTMSDVEMLQNELNSVRELDGSRGSSLLQNITQELQAAKRELASIKEEGFQFMASIDVIRNELNHVTTELAQVKEEEGKVESKVQNLNSKLLRAKSKLESVSNDEEKAKSIATSLSVSLEELKAETEAARKEKEIITQENRTTKEEIKATELEIDMNEEKLQAAMQELEVIKALESEALEKLKTLTKNTMRERALAAKHSSTITISTFEYEYLTNHAAVAEEIADKKVEAAHAWIKALEASEHEISVRTKIVLREIKETKKEEEIMEVNPKEKLVSKRVSQDRLENLAGKRGKSSSNYNLQRSTSRKSIKLSNGTMVPAKQAKFQKSASPAGRHVSLFAMRKKKMVITHLASLFKGKRNTRNSYIRENERKQWDSV